MHRQSEFAYLVIFLSRHQPATLEILKKTNSSQSKDGSRNPASLKKGLFAIAVNKKTRKRSLSSHNTYFRYGKVSVSVLKIE